MDEQQPWHQLFALSWRDFFHGRPVTVEAEKDLSIKKQLLDVLLTRADAAALDYRLPDGFEDLATYNLITFKSHQDTMSGFTLEELLGHSVNLRKQVSPSMDEHDLLPATDFRLFAVCARYPQHLANSVPLREVMPGVYEVQPVTQRIRIIVANRLPLAPHNALLLLFSSKPEVVN